MTRRLATILWPAFLMAAVLEMLVFAVVDPGQLHGPSGEPLPLSTKAIYSLSFFMFWAVTAAGCAITAFLADQGGP
jgi:hypothetical protein